MSPQMSTSEANGTGSRRARVRTSVAGEENRSTSGKQTGNRQERQPSSKSQTSHLRELSQELERQSRQEQVTRQENSQSSPKEKTQAVEGFPTERKQSAAPGCDPASAAAAERERDALGDEQHRKLGSRGTARSQSRERDEQHRRLGSRGTARSQSLAKEEQIQVIDEDGRLGKDGDEQGNGDNDEYLHDSGSLLHCDARSDRRSCDPKEARAVLEVGREGCGCFPARSSRAVPSMLYDQVRCVHYDLMGHAHVGVFQFDGNWGTTPRVTDKVKAREQSRSAKMYVMGYPEFVLPRPHDDSVHLSGKDRCTSDSDRERREYAQLATRSDRQGKTSKEETASFDKEGLSCPAPSLAVPKSQPSRAASMRQGSFSETQDVLPSTLCVAATTAARAGVERISVLPVVTAPCPLSSQGSGVDVLPVEVNPACKFVPRTRTFRGEYYDPGTKQSYAFEVTPDFGRHLHRWNARKERIAKQTRCGFDQANGNDQRS